ncbi:MAG: putative DNA-binding protein [Candidatus Methanohalarchaeum thermophilum]|uniref:UPF0251 protein BTN85_0392 n=1 Tax=Methanohalarchaeum thermophilum TaxID=1903181 RepID=A0A1Q6DU87_METT1|nr:MAG: putative DNA-binding protein [Candidatus Methanohalarchaeum thermophilum]
MGKRKRKRGRPRCPRKVKDLPEADVFKPRGIPARELERTKLNIEELEAVRLTDIEDMTQNEAANEMGISRKSFWNDLKKARRKIAEALVQGKAIEIRGGNYSIEKDKKEENKEN